MGRVQARFGRRVGLGRCETWCGIRVFDFGVRRVIWNFVFPFWCNGVGLRGKGKGKHLCWIILHWLSL